MFTGSDIEDSESHWDWVRRDLAPRSGSLVALGVVFPTDKKSSTVKVYDAKTKEPFSPSSHTARALGLTSENFSFEDTGQLTVYPISPGPVLRLVFASDRKRTSESVRVYDKDTQRVVSRLGEDTKGRNFKGGYAIDVVLNIWSAKDLVVGIVMERSKLEKDIPLQTGGQVLLREGVIQVCYFGPYAVAPNESSKVKGNYFNLDLDTRYLHDAENEFGMVAMRFFHPNDEGWAHSYFDITGIDSNDRDFRLFARYPNGKLFFALPYDLSNNHSFSVVRMSTMSGDTQFMTGGGDRIALKYPVKRLRIEETYNEMSTYNIQGGEQVGFLTNNGDLLDVPIPYLKFYRSGGAIKFLRIAAEAAQLDVDPNGFEKTGSSSGLPDSIENQTPRDLMLEYEKITGLRLRLDSENNVIKVVR